MFQQPVLMGKQRREAELREFKQGQREAGGTAWRVVPCAAKRDSQLGGITV